MALVLLGLTPAEFWKLTPSETADLIWAYRKRENRIAIRKAWELHNTLSPHVDHEDPKVVEAISTVELFRRMPGAFPEDETFVEPERKLSPEKQAERERRMKIPRLQRRR